MKTIQVINHIENNPNYDVIVIGGSDDMTRMEAILHLLSLPPDENGVEKNWRLNGSLQKNTLLIYEH